MPLQPGTTLGPYEIQSQLGAGGMGEVYKARDTRLNRTVAIKVLPEHVASDPELKARFEREARTVAALNHPHICTLHDIGQQDGTDFLVMEYLDGETLAQRLEKGALPPAALLRIGREVAEAMEAAHRAGLVHRDLKPANVMLTKAGTKVLDFGLAKSVKTQAPQIAQDAPTMSQMLTREGTVVGTLPYMAPEQLEHRDADARTDIWALGCLLYEMATGTRPFQADTQAGLITAIMSSEPVAPTRRQSPTPTRLDWVIQRCLEKDPERRWQSSRDVAIELETLGATDDEAVTDQVSGSSATSHGVAVPADVAARQGTVLWRRPRALAAGVVAMIVLVLGLVFQQSRMRQERQSAERVEWARQEALPEVMRLIEAREYGGAFDLATEVEQVIPNDAVLLELWTGMSNQVSVETDPPGADVFYRENGRVEDDWQLLGQSPLIDRRLPLGGFRLRIEKDGYEPRELLSSLSYPQSDGAFEPLPSFSTPDVRNHISLRLDPVGSVPPGMIAVDGGPYLVPLTDFPSEAVTLEPYFIDRTEVTNAAFKEFVDAGGYESREFWRQEFRRGSEVLTWEDAMALLVDTTGRRGPAGWELGNYPSGQAEYPVGGVSWYEASAYAAFRGRELPTVYHWLHAAMPSGEHTLSLAPEIVPLSNFGGDGPLPVGSSPGIGVSGAVDLAGNVREWCWNLSGEGHFVLGGGWSEPAYTFTSPSRPGPFDRSFINGLRLMQARDEPTRENLRADVVLTAETDFYEVDGITEEAFATAKRFFTYGDTPLDPQLEEVDDSSPDWRRESVSIDAAYGNERFTVHLDLPRRAAPPYQAVVYFPGSNALEQVEFEDAYWERFDYIPRSGRVLVRPILAGMYERSVQATAASRQTLAVRYLQDLGRTLDYLESRGDVDTSRVAYMGLSLGSTWSPIMMAYEDRFKVGVLIAGGLWSEEGARNAPRVTAPVLLLGGRYDYLFPLETKQRPFIDLLGTPEQDKRHVVFEAGHLPLPRAEVIRETLAWLDRYQNPVVSLPRPGQRGEPINR